ncbi:MAG TPA: NADP-dependent oxidoreductase [Thermoguttaceae bacterium]|nr:NADP-dependent oxidoreductase [Thermoguttaceae bacterium]
MAKKDHHIILAARPEGLPKETDFKPVEAPMPEPGEGQFLVKINYLSVDPYMRGRISEIQSYAEPVAIGDVMVGGTVGRVIDSRHPEYNTGDVVVGYSGWQEYAVSDSTGVQPFDTSRAPMSTAPGVLGMPGMTAYFGLMEIGQPRPGQTVFISGAAGAVGSLVGQIAKIHGCRIVGSAGSKEKVDWLLEDMGFDAAFNYKEAGDYVAKLKEACQLDDDDTLSDHPNRRPSDLPASALESLAGGVPPPAFEPKRWKASSRIRLPAQSGCRQPVTAHGCAETR